MIFIINICTNCTVTRVNPMIKSILPSLLLATSTAVLATPYRGSSDRDNYYPIRERATLCEEVNAELLLAVEQGAFSREFVDDVYTRCREWAQR